MECSIDVSSNDTLDQTNALSFSVRVRECERSVALRRHLHAIVKLETDCHCRIGVVLDHVHGARRVDLSVPHNHVVEAAFELGAETQLVLGALAPVNHLGAAARSLRNTDRKAVNGHLGLAVDHLERQMEPFATTSDYFLF